MGEAVKALPGSGGRGGIEEFDIFQAVREELAEWLGISCPERIALGCNSTWGLNQGIFGFPLRPGDTVLTTRAEHNAVLRPLYRLEQQGIRVIYLDVDRTGRVSPEAWEKALDRFSPETLCPDPRLQRDGGGQRRPQADGGQPTDTEHRCCWTFPRVWDGCRWNWKIGRWIWLYSQDTNIFWGPRGPAASTCGRGWN